MAGLDAERQKRALHRIALDDPAATAVAQLGIVAEERGPARSSSVRSSARIDRAAGLEVEAALRRVADAGDRRSAASAVIDLRTVISLRVSVPVLSEQMTETEPSVSTAGRRRMMALRARHALHADRQRDGHHRRQAFRDGGDRDADHTMKASGQW